MIMNSRTLTPQLFRRSYICSASKKGERSSYRPGPPSKKALNQAREQRQAAEASIKADQPAQSPGSPQTEVQNTKSLNEAPYKSPQPSLGSSTSSPVTPQAVVDRIFVRMVACAGVPVLTGVLLLVVFALLKRQGGDDFPLWPAYLSQGISFTGGLLGISYGALSASWDPRREGSLLGWTEFQANLPIFLNSKKKD